MSTRRPRIWWKRWLAVTVLLWAAAAAVTGLKARDHALRGEALARNLMEVRTVEALTNADLAQLELDAREAAVEFDDAERELSRGVLWPVAQLPILGRQVQSAQALAVGGSAIATSVAPVIATADTILSETEEPDRVAQLREIEGVLDNAQSVASSVDLGPASGLLGPLVDARDEFAQQTTEYRETTTKALVAVRGMASLMEDSNYLLLVPNNGEMRLASGMPLSVGELRIVDGDIQSPTLTPANELFPVPTVPIVDDDVEARWGFLKPTNDYRKLAYSARFSEWSAPQAIMMWNNQKNVEVDGVVSIDPFVLGALLDVTGPVTVGNLTVDASSATEYLLIDQYVEYADRAVEVQDKRRERQAVLAGAIVSSFSESSWDPLDLLQVLEPLALGRHIMVYSSDPTEQAAWESLGVAGKLTGNEVGVYLLNLTASKTDPYVDVSVDYSEEPVEAGTQVTLDMTIVNRTPADVPEFVAGVWDSIGIGYGDYLGRIAIYAPAAATDLAFEPAETLEVFGPDGQVWVMASRIEIKRGQTQRRTATFIIPAEQATMTVLPSARYYGVEWTIGEDVVIDEAPIEIVVGG